MNKTPRYLIPLLEVESHPKSGVSKPFFLNTMTTDQRCQFLILMLHTWLRTTKHTLGIHTTNQTGQHHLQHAKFKFLTTQTGNTHWLHHKNYFSYSEQNVWQIVALAMSNTHPKQVLPVLTSSIANQALTLVVQGPQEETDAFIPRHLPGDTTWTVVSLVVPILH